MPVSGEYKLECWGASGVNGGNGGYSSGNKIASLKTTVYICVGGSRNYYNNQIGTLKSFYMGGQAGGGATSITTTNRGELKNFKSYQNEVLLVAGGGGGCEWNGTGGAGGGLTGMSGSKTASLGTGALSNSYGTGGSQSSGGINQIGQYTVGTQYKADFGVGGIASQASDGDFGAQGGGGWYGGGGSCFAGAAGGGSSHGNTSLLESNSFVTIDGEHEMPSVSGGKETGHSEHGACVITQVNF